MQEVLKRLRYVSLGVIYSYIYIYIFIQLQLPYKQSYGYPYGESKIRPSFTPSTNNTFQVDQGPNSDKQDLKCTRVVANDFFILPQKEQILTAKAHIFIQLC